MVTWMVDILNPHRGHLVSPSLSHTNLTNEELSQQVLFTDAFNCQIFSVIAGATATCLAVLRPAPGRFGHFLLFLCPHKGC